MVAKYSLAIILAAVTVAGPAHAKDPVKLMPLGEWEMADPSPDACVVARLFGDEDNVHVLRLEQSYPGNSVGFWAAGAEFRYFTNYEDVKVQLAEGGHKVSVRPLTAMLPGVGKAVIARFSQTLIDAGADEASRSKGELSGGMKMLDPAQGSQAEYVSLERGSDPAVRLATGGMEEPFTMLNTCALDLLRQWGLDPDKHQTATRQVRWRNQAAITRKVLGSYRAAGLNTGERGRLNVRLIVDENGKVQSCIVTTSAATEGLNSPVCEIMAEAQFDPALDAQGKPFASFYATAVTYQL